mmetsp:Transcript_22739/g.32493  ORF Transcript_22739/g.32493 Transcript_22739/m.32493 type:complete len:696 (-) Transcript_22739:100-2187(-)
MFFWQIMSKRNPYDIHNPLGRRTPNGWYTPNYAHPPNYASAHHAPPPPHYHPPPSHHTTPYSRSYHGQFSYPNEEHPSAAALSVNFGPPPPLEEWQVARKTFMLENARKRKKSSPPERAAINQWQDAVNKEEDFRAMVQIAEEPFDLHSDPVYDKENVLNAAPDERKPPAVQRQVVTKVDAPADDAVPEDERKLPAVQPQVVTKVDAPAQLTDGRLGTVDDVCGEVEDNRGETSSLKYKGYFYSKHNKLKKGRNYVCCSRSICKGSLHIDNAGEVHIRKPHSDACVLKNGSAPAPPKNDDAQSARPDLRGRQKIFVEMAASKSGSIDARQIALDCIAQCDRDYPDGYQTLKVDQLINRAYNVNAKATQGSNLISAAEKDHMDEDDEQNVCMRGHHTFIEPGKRNKSYGTKQRIVAFSCFQLLTMMKMRMLEVQVDCTFKIVPRDFYQLMIWIIFDHTIGAFVPCYWILMTGATAACYDSAFNMLRIDLGDEFHPFAIGIDFERNFINMTKKHWPRAHQIGCFFHFKQAMRRKLKNLGFPDKYVGNIMAPGMLDLVTVLPAEDVSDIDGKGWFFISYLIDTPQADKEVEEWRSSPHGKTMIADFFFYIQGFWLDILPTWNWAAFTSMKIEDEQGNTFMPRFRASAYIESYNGKIGTLEHPHPKLSLAGKKGLGKRMQGKRAILTLRPRGAPARGKK